jgi:hypothetical protein
MGFSPVKVTLGDGFGQHEPAGSAINYIFSVSTRRFLSYEFYKLSLLETDVCPIAQEQPPAPTPTLDEIDVTRHREITSKAVSAILLLVLKWFKVSHVMKFHHLGQLLLDTNCLLLILKMFGLQEVSVSVVSRADSPENK